MRRPPPQRGRISQCTAPAGPATAIVNSTDESAGLVFLPSSQPRPDVRVKIPTDLLDDARNGDPDAFNQLFDLCSGHIFRFIYTRIPDLQLAEDLTGNVFLKVYEAINRGQPWKYTFTSWLYTIANNQIRDHIRRDVRAAFFPIDTHMNLPSREPDPFRATRDSLDAESLRAAIARLPDSQAQVISLRFLEGYGVKEVAAIMGKTEVSIRAMQFRAIKELRAALARDLG